MARQSSKESTARLFHRYVWLVDLIYRYNHRITFEEINNRWVNSDLNGSGEDFPLKTFHNHKAAIRDMFDIDIECDKRNGYTYYIENSDDMERGGVRSWLLNTFAINNLINESHKLKSRILFENIPSGQQFLTPIIEAMRDEVTVEMTYQNYWSSEPHTFEVKPYCVKVFKQRWYLLAWSDYYEAFRIYSLDRIKSIRATDNKFTIPSDFNAEEYFQNCFGIINTNHKPEFVELKVWNEEKKDRYFKSLPLHHSQDITEQTDQYTIFRYYIKPTFDFRQEILSHGAEVEVLSPKWFRDEITSISKDLANSYNANRVGGKQK